MKLAYFPGCSLKGLGRAYEESLLPVMRHLGVELLELDDWNCCGATAYMAVDEVKACVLAARNLALACVGAAGTRGGTNGAGLDGGAPATEGRRGRRLRRFAH